MQEMDSEIEASEPDPWDDPESAREYRLEVERQGQQSLFGFSPAVDGGHPVGCGCVDCSSRAMATGCVGRSV